MVPPADYRDWRQQTHGFEDMAAWRVYGFILAGARDHRRPAFVCAGHAIMDGKLLLSHSRSRVFLAKRLNIWLLRRQLPDLKSIRGLEVKLHPVPHLLCVYLESVNSTLPIPVTSTGLVWDFMPSCQATTLYLPSGTFSILKFPSASVSAKYGVGLTIM